MAALGVVELGFRLGEAGLHLLALWGQGLGFRVVLEELLFALQSLPLALLSKVQESISAEGRAAQGAIRFAFAQHVVSAAQFLHLAPQPLVVGLKALDGADDALDLSAPGLDGLPLALDGGLGLLCVRKSIPRGMPALHPRPKFALRAVAQPLRLRREPPGRLRDGMLQIDRLPFERRVALLLGVLLLQLLPCVGQE